ncbi:MAG: hypothetical protein RCG15_02685 [Candidatus Rickettsia vulgarisii]
MLDVKGAKPTTLLIDTLVLFELPEESLISTVLLLVFFSLVLVKGLLVRFEESGLCVVSFLINFLKNGF